MENRDDILKQHLSEQIALEEDLYRIIQEQIVEIDEARFADAKSLLARTGQTLETHFTPLNELLDKLELDAVAARTRAVGSNGGGFKNPLERVVARKPISKILRDDYSALNLITISISQLHTAALVLESKDVARVALKHLENLAPLVVRLGELVPQVVARELRNGSEESDPEIAQTALKNIRLAWRTAP